MIGARHPLVQLTLARFREFARQPETVFWVFAFPLLLAIALGIAFRNRPPDRVRIALSLHDGAAHHHPVGEQAAPGSRGFRSGAMYRRQDWFADLEFSYDMSIPNVAHLEPQRGGRDLPICRNCREQGCNADDNSQRINKAASNG